MPRRVAVIGGNGLVARSLWTRLSLDSDLQIRIVSRSRPSTLPHHVESVECDITRGVAAIAPGLAGCDLVVNASSHVGDDAQQRSSVNVRGVASLIEAARIVGGIPLVQMSTAGVYGTLPEQGGDEHAYSLAPESPLSRSRAEGDRIALDNGATVLRPLFITGAGDSHFLLPMLRAHLALGAWIDDGAARLSVASAEYVANATAVIACRLLGGQHVRIAHLVPDPPITVRELVAPVLASAGVHISRSIGVDDAVAALGSRGVPERKVRQFASDYFLSSSVLPVVAPDLSSSASPISPQAAAWYAAQIGTSSP